MAFGISGSDPFRSYSSDAEAGGGMGVYGRRKRKKEDDEEKKEDNLLEMADDQDEDNLELDMEDSDFLD